MSDSVLSKYFKSLSIKLSQEHCVSNDLVCDNFHTGSVIIQ